MPVSVSNLSPTWAVSGNIPQSFDELEQKVERMELLLFRVRFLDYEYIDQMLAANEFVDHYESIAEPESESSPSKTVHEEPPSCLTSSIRASMPAHRQHLLTRLWRMRWMAVMQQVVVRSP